MSGGQMKGACPICGSGMILKFTPYEVPYFGEIMIFSAMCSCGYRSTDVMILSERRNRRYELEVTSEEDLNVRVVRSHCGRIEIPELGVVVEPKRGEAFISNVEGVLQRVEDVLKFLERDADEKQKEKIAELFRKIEEIKAGRRRMRLIIEDPTGNSAIISEKAKVE
ncbi:MAG: C4-type Zn-finger protein [Candidatus Alkanophagales archaeon MCA70_species_1]|nr:C4-type Zn-finger protein [Candidatus Alkanophaga volatiphilum]